MSDMESVNSEFSDAIRERIKSILKQRFMNYSCKGCDMIKLAMMQGFINGVCERTFVNMWCVIIVIRL